VERGGVGRGEMIARDSERTLEGPPSAGSRRKTEEMDNARPNKDCQARKEEKDRTLSSYQEFN